VEFFWRIATAGAILAFRVNGVEGQRRFSGAADAADHGNGVVGNLHRDIFQVVHARAADAQRFLIQLAGYGLGKSFVFCQEEAWTARAASAA